MTYSDRIIIIFIIIIIIIVYKYPLWPVMLASALALYVVTLLASLSCR